MSIDLRFNPAAYETGSVEVNGAALAYRLYRNIPYVSAPNAPAVQVMNIYVPEALAEDHTAPIYLIQRTGGMGGAEPYTIEKELETLEAAHAFEAKLKQGGAANVQKNESYSSHTGQWHDSTRGFIPRALAEGYILVSPGARGRDTVADGVYVGRGELPMSIVDLKAAIRYLHYNKGIIPGDPDRIIADGTSSGGGMSVLLGVTGNSRHYDKYLMEIGAAPARDDIYCAVVNSPITDFKHIDLAYEWMFSVDNVKGLFADDPVASAMSRAMAKRYEEYVNSLNLKHPLTGEPIGFGEKDTYTPYFIRQINDSATIYLSSLSEEERQAWLNDERNHGVVSWDGQRAEITSLSAFINWNSGRWMRYVGCYDGFDTQPSRENEAFGSTDGSGYGHFSPDMGEIISGFNGFEETGKAWLESAKANARGEYLINPVNFIGTDEKADIAPVWYMRCGAHHETTLNLFFNIVLLLREHTNALINARYSWTMRHTTISNIQCDETFAFMNRHCKA